MQDVKTLLISSIKDITLDSIIYLDGSTEKKIILKECAINYANDFNSKIDNYILIGNDDVPFKKEILNQLSGDNSWKNEPNTRTPDPINVYENRCIGERDWFADKPYFIFYSEPKVKFQIEPKKRFLDIFNKHWCQRYYPDFFKVQIKLQQYNWHTFDLG